MANYRKLKPTNCIAQINTHQTIGHQIWDNQFTDEIVNEINKGLQVVANIHP